MRLINQRRGCLCMAALAALYGALSVANALEVPNARAVEFPREQQAADGTAVEPSFDQDITEDGNELLDDQSSNDAPGLTNVTTTTTAPPIPATTAPTPPAMTPMPTTKSIKPPPTSASIVPVPTTESVRPSEPPAPTTGSPTEAPTPTTTRPAMRTNSPIDAATSNNAKTNQTTNGVSPAMLVAFAVLCTFFLALWSRRRRGSGAEATAEGSSSSSSDMSGMATTTSKEKGSCGSGKVQYSRIENQEEEDDEYGGRSGSWDDWENQGQSHGVSHTHRVTIRDDDEDSEDDNGRIGLTRGLTSSSSSLAPPSPPRSGGGGRGFSPSIQKLASPPLSQNDRLKEIMLSDLTPAKGTSVGSNSSNESYEVVVTPPPPPAIPPPPPAHQAPVDLLSGVVSALKSQSSAEVAPPEDDLFSQFGMVPTFKKGVQQTPAPVARSPYSSPPTSALNPFAASPPPSTGAAVGAVSASALFAAELDDISVSADEGTNEWGEEDDDWVQGL